MPKVVITPRSYGMFNEEVFELWEKENFEVIREIGPLDEGRLIELLEDADALLVGTDKLSPNVLKHAKKLKIISKYGVGIDNIPLEFASDNGITVVNTPGVNTESVADYTFSLMLGVARDVPNSDNRLKNGEWKKSVGIEIYRKTLGILGFGSIGKSVARRAKGFDMKVLVYDLFRNEEVASKMGVEFVELDTIIEQSDVISIHLPLTNETRNLFNYDTLKRMKRNGIIVNTARGGIINENDLSKALKEELIFGAGIDVFNNEPLVDSPLMNVDNAVLTPHNAAASSEAVERMTIQSTNNVLNFFQSRQINKVR